MSQQGTKRRSSLILQVICGLAVITGGMEHRAMAAEPSLEQRPAIDRNGFDGKVRPQDDFFRFVNGAWLDTTEIPADQGRWGSFMILRDQSAEHVRAIVEDLNQTEDLAADSEQQKVRDLYRSFMDQQRIEELGLEPLQDEFARIDGIANRDQLAAYFARAAGLRVSNPISIDVSQDAKQPDQYAVEIGQSGLGLPDRDYYFDDGERAQELRSKYVAHVTKMLQLGGLADPPATASQIMRLETDLAQHQWTRVDNRDREKTYNKLQSAELDPLSPGFAWRIYLDQAGVADQEAVIVRQPTYLSGFSQVVEKTDLEVWKSYLKWHLLNASAPYLSTPLVEQDFEFFGRTLSGLEELEPRWKRGVHGLDGMLGQLVGKEYVRRHFPPEAKERMEALVRNLTLTMGDSIRKLDWMTETTRQQALAKLDKFNTKIGYPDVWKDYAALKIDPQDLIGNLRRVAEFEYRRDLDKLGGPIDRNEWLMNPQTVNAYYNASLNEIVFPAAILQPPFFHLAADDAVNYGAIGAVIGHEIGHGFDDQGRKSDGNGLLRDWWSREDALEYTKRAQKLVEQYESYRPLEDLHINGQLTLGENIGDLGGIMIAYRAYLRSLDGKEPPVIDGETGPQRFFLAFGQIWRMKSRDDTLRQQIKTDPHSPAPYRVIGVLRNFEPFYEAFGVKQGDGMYLDPSERVSIW